MPAQVYARDIRFAAVACDFVTHTPLVKLDIHVPIQGQHQVVNALVAIATALAVGCDLVDIQKGLAKVQAVQGRFKPYRLASGALVIDDTYNASARSVKSALEALGQHPGQRIFVMSNMGALGEHAEALPSRNGSLGGTAGR